MDNILIYPPTIRANEIVCPFEGKKVIDLKGFTKSFSFGSGQGLGVELLPAISNGAYLIQSLFGRSTKDAANPNVNLHICYLGYDQDDEVSNLFGTNTVDTRLNDVNLFSEVANYQNFMTNRLDLNYANDQGTNVYISGYEVKLTDL